MSKYDFILDNIRFSFSSTSTFNTCAYSYKLTYIDNQPRLNNFFGEYGTLIHECFEKFFTLQLNSFELSNEYRSKYDKIVRSDPPPFPAGMAEKYKVTGQTFFDEFEFDLNKYKVILVEDKIDFDFEGFMFVAKPDLVLFDKETNEYILFDYKTSTPLKVSKATGKETWDKKKIDGYMKQMYIYAYALRNYKFIPIDKITLWFPRLNRMVTNPWKLSEETLIMQEIKENLVAIKNEEEFKYDNSNSYFCNQLCSVRNSCKYR